MSLETFGNEERPSDEIADDSKIANKKKAAFKENTESYLNYRFTVTGDSHSLNPLCIICGDWQFKKAMKPSKLLHHVVTKHPALKDKPLEFFKRKKHEQKQQKQLLKVTTSSNVSALRASLLLADHTAKAKKPFTIGEELILPAAKDLCHELLGDTAVQ